MKPWMLTVGELKQKLSKCPDDLVVMLDVNGETEPAKSGSVVMQDAENEGELRYSRGDHPFFSYPGLTKALCICSE